MNNFFIGVASSLAATALFVVFSQWRKVRWWKFLSGSGLFRHGIEFVHTDQNAAVAEIEQDMRRSRTIRVFTMRGYSFVFPEREFAFMLDQPEKAIRLLVAHPGTKRKSNPEIERRAS